MKRLLTFVLLLSCLASTQTKTVITGTVQDAAGALAATGTVEFKIVPGSSAVWYTITGTTTIAAQTGMCKILAGVILATDGVLTCQIWSNDFISPANTCYDVTFKPNGTTTNTIHNVLVRGASMSMNAPTFCTPVKLVPQYTTLTTDPVHTNIVPGANGQFFVGLPNYHYAGGYFDNLYFGPGQLNVANLSGSGDCSPNFVQKLNASVGPTCASTNHGVINTDNYASIQLAIDAASNNGNVVVSPGVSLITSQLNVSGLSNFRLSCAQGAIIRASGGSITKMLSITNASTDVHIGESCVWDGNNLSNLTNGIVVVSGATAGASPQRIWITGNEVKNLPLASAQLISASFDGNPSHAWLSSGIFIQNNYVHDVGGKAISVGRWDNVNVTDNRIANADLGGTGQEVLSVGVSNQVTVSGNIVTDIPCGVFTNRVGGFAVSNFTFTNNVIVAKAGCNGATAASSLYVDTGVNGVFSGNMIYGQFGNNGVFCEACHNVSITGNSLFESAGLGILVRGRQDNIQKNALDTTTGLTADPSVTLSVDAGDKQEGTGSVQAVIGGGFTTGTLFYQNITPADWTQEPVNDGNARNAFDLWVKSDTNVAPGVLQLQLSANTGLTSPSLSTNIPVLAAGQWLHLRLVNPRWYSPMTSVQSWGITALSNPGAITLHFDSLEAVTTSEDVNVVGNSISHSGAYGIEMRGMFDSLISSNVVSDPGWNSNIGGAAGIHLVASTIAGSNRNLKSITVAGNMLRTTPNLNTSISGIFVQQTGAATIDSIRLVGNDISPNFTTSIQQAGVITNLTTDSNLQQQTIIDTNNAGAATPQLILRDTTNLLSKTFLGSFLDGAGGTTFRIEPTPPDATHQAQVEIFRGVNTSGARKVIVRKGDGTATTTITIDAATGDIAPLSTTINGDSKMTAAPRGTFSGNGSLAYGTGTSNMGKLVIDKAITVTRVNIAGSQTISCATTYPVIRVSDGSTNIDTTLSNASAWDSGGIATNYAAGATLSIGVQTAGVGCGAGNLLITVQYRMQ